MNSEAEGAASKRTGGGRSASRDVAPAAQPSAPFKLVLLGRFSLTGPQGPIDLGSRKLCALLAYMACTAPQPQSREGLTTLLWGSHFEAQARQNLRQALSRLRRALGDDILASDDDAIRIRRDMIHCDAQRFETRIRAGSYDSLTEAVDLYQGTFLASIAIPQEAWADWVNGQRHRLENMAVNALIRLGEEEEKRGNAERALEMANRAVAIDGLREDGHRLIMRGLAAVGRRAEALKHYDQLAARLKRDLNVEPDAATAALVADLRQPFRPVTGAAAAQPGSPDGVSASSTVGEGTATAAGTPLSQGAAEPAAAPVMARPRTVSEFFRELMAPVSLSDRVDEPASDAGPGDFQGTRQLPDSLTFLPIPSGRDTAEARETRIESASTVTRRLAAIAFADVVGWSRLVEQNDMETLRAWKALRADIIEPRFREHHGRLQETSGDALLMEFPSAVAAVTWAIQTQRGLSEPQPSGGTLRLTLRISINVEDVIVDEDTVIGDGVNIASRILQLAAPGEIVVTGTVRDYVWNKMPVTFADLGERELRNISRPIRVYRIETPGVASSIPAPRQPHLSWTQRPAIAVLPFRNLGNPEKEYFSEGITEDIIGGLSRSHALYVIAWNSTLRYRSRQMESRDIATELGVRYILEGSVRRRASRMRISSELIDATNSRTLWADKFDGADSEIFEFQDHIANRIVGAIEPKLYRAESARAFTKPTGSLDAYDCVLRALPLLYTLNDQQFIEAGQYLERAVLLDPAYAQAHAWLAWWLNLKSGEGRSTDLVVDSDRAVGAAMRAVELDPEDAFCLAVAGHIQGFLNNGLDDAVDLFDRALSLNNNSAFAWGVGGSTYCFLGHPDEALERLRNAWRLSPFDPLNFWFCTVAGLAEFVAGRYDQAIGWLRKAQRLNPRFSACNRTLAASLALGGDVEAAKAVGRQLLAIEPSFRTSVFTSWYPLRRQNDLQRLAEGFRLAGLPA